MARPGTASSVRSHGAGPQGDTRAALVSAAVAALREDGFGRASARNIAARAGCNQALVFYHFGSVADLLLAALDEVSAQRLDQYRDAVAEGTSIDELVPVAARIFREDLDKGYVTVLAEMIGGASSTPGLGPEVAKRIRPWRQFARDALDDAMQASGLGGVIPGESVAHAVVALYLGLELLANLDGDRKPALALFKDAEKLAGVLRAFSPTGGST
jgi:AcrR family transcriptional regulator